MPFNSFFKEVRWLFYWNRYYLRGKISLLTNYLVAGMIINEIFEFIDKEAIVQMLASFVGVAGALWVFRLTTKKAEEKEKEDQHRLEIDKIKYIYHLMIGSRDFAGQFRKDFELFCKRFSDNPLRVPEFSKPVPYTIKRFVEKINQEEHFHAYKKQIRFGNSITSIFSNIDYIDALFINVFEQYKEILARHVEKGTQCTAILNECTFMIVEDVRLLQNYQDKNTEMLDLLGIYDTAKSEFLKVNTKGDFGLIQSNFILPLSKGIFNYQKKTSDKNFENTFKMLATANQILVSIESNNLNAIKSFDSELESLNKVYYRLMQNMQSIESFVAIN
jgi:hypothetical protein